MKRHIAKGQLHEAVSLKPFNSWHIGGPAEYLYWPRDLPDLQRFLRSLDASMPITYLGLGSNVLIPDAGLKGVVILTQGSLDELTLCGDAISAGAGLSCAKVARFAAHHQRVGGEFLAGIPGTIGGALRMNAGAFGGETWPCVQQVVLVNRQGALIHKKPEDFHIGYRQVTGLDEGEWFVSATFSFSPGDGRQSLADIKALLAKRSVSQPTGEPSCGSVFKNPPGKFAAELIDSLGLKGLCIGGACVSSKHANFIINQGDAKADDVLAIMSLIQVKVKAAFGVLLEPEVWIAGDPHCHK